MCVCGVFSFIFQWKIKCGILCSALKSKFRNKKTKHKLFSVLLHCQRLLSLQADHASGFHIRSVLCVPIWNRTHQIIGKLPRDNQLVLTGKPVFVLQIDNDGFVVSTGVAQILNRLDRKTFNDADQRLFEVSFWKLWLQLFHKNFKFTVASDKPYTKSPIMCLFFFLCVQAFVIFCGLGINNTMMYNQVKKTWAKQSVALDVRPATYWSHQILLFFSHHFRRHLNIWCNIQCIIFCLCVFFCVCLWLFFLIVYCFFPPYFFYYCFCLLFIFFIILPLSLWLSKCDILYANYKR